MKKFMRKLIVSIVVVSIILALPVVAQNDIVLKNSDIKYLKSSFDIELKNIDSRSLVETHPLDSERKEFLQSLGYSTKKVESMDVDEYNKIYAKLHLSKSSQEFLMEFFGNELSIKEIENWTNEDYQKFMSEKNKNSKKSIDRDTLKKLKSIGLEVHDAEYLLKYYITYDALMSEDVEVLKDRLINYYTFKLEYLKNLNYHDANNKANEYMSFITMTSYARDTPGSSDIDKYRLIYDFYGARGSENGIYVSKSALTHYADTMEYQEQKACLLYKKIYGSSESPDYTQIWGEYYDDLNGAHEGIDMVGGGTIKNPIDVDSECLDDGKGSSYKVVLFNDENTYNLKRSYFFMHMSPTTVTEGSIYSYGDSLGTENNKNKDGLSNYMGEHLHFAIERGRTTSTHYQRNSHTLESYNPYSFQ